MARRAPRSNSARKRVESEVAPPETPPSLELVVPEHLAAPPASGVSSELAMRVYRTEGNARRCRVCRALTMTRIEFGGTLSDALGTSVVYDACDEHATRELLEPTYREYLEARRGTKPT